MGRSAPYLGLVINCLPSAAAGLVAIAMTAAPVVARPVPASPDAGACGDQPAMLHIHVSGFKNGAGTVRVQAYGADPAAFLQKGKWVRRVDVPLNGRSALDVCLGLPQPGRYALAVRHDANASGKSDWNDGAGFSRNPSLSLMRPKPAFDKVVIAVARGSTRVPIVMNYRHGLSIGPEAGRAAD